MSANSNGSRSERSNELSFSFRDECTNLTQLNQRLRKVFDLNKKLRNDNERLSIEINTVNSDWEMKYNSSIDMYKKQFDQLQTKLEDEINCKTKLQVQYDTANARLCESTYLLDEITKRDLENTEELCMVKSQNQALEGKAKLTEKLEKEVFNLKKRFAEAEMKNRYLLNQCRNIKGNHKANTAQIAALQLQIEQEVLTRATLENKLARAKETLEFMTQEHKTEIENIRDDIDVPDSTIVMNNKYEEEVTERVTDRIEDVKESIETIYSEKLQELKSFHADQLLGFHDENKNLKDLVSTLQQNMSEAQLNLKSLRDQVQEQRYDHGQERERLMSSNSQLQGEINTLNAKLFDDAQKSSMEIASLQNQLSEMIIKQQEVFSVDRGVGVELSVLGKIVSEEENRIGITPVKRSQGSPSISKAKKQRMSLTSPKQSKVGKVINRYKHNVKTMEGQVIEFIKNDNEKNITISNPSLDTIKIGGWKIRRFVGSSKDPPCEYKFHGNKKIQPNSTLTVWSASEVGESEPEKHMYSKDWSVEDNMNTVLINDMDEEVAVMEKILISSQPISSPGCALM